MTTGERRRGQIYGRRKGPGLSPHRQKLRRELLPQLALKAQADRDPRSYFSVPVAEVWLEIGFGGGEHLLWQALHHPRVGVIGAEPYEPGVAKLLAALSEPALESVRTRVRIEEGDAREIIAALPEASLSRVFLLFPDPWPKRRHHKRRFIQTALLDQLARVMRDGAEFRVASDDAEYASWALEHVLAHPCFSWSPRRALDWETRPEDWPETRYEKKALAGSATYFRFRRTEKPLKDGA